MLIVQKKEPNELNQTALISFKANCALSQFAIGYVTYSKQERKVDKDGSKQYAEPLVIIN